jgi:hypothetical protein
MSDYERRLCGKKIDVDFLKNKTLLRYIMVMLTTQTEKVIFNF